MNRLDEKVNVQPLTTARKENYVAPSRLNQGHRVVYATRSLEFFSSSDSALCLI